MFFEFFFFFWWITYCGCITVLGVISKEMIILIHLHYVQFSRSVMSDSLRPHEPQHTRPPCPSPTPGVHPNSCPLSWWCHPATLILCRPLLCLPSIFPSIRVFSSESALCIRWPKYCSFSFNTWWTPPMNTWDWFPLGGLVGSPCSPRDSQESSPTPQFKSTQSLALSFLYSPTLTSIPDHWKNHSFDYTDPLLTK